MKTFTEPSQKEIERVMQKLKSRKEKKTLSGEAIRRLTQDMMKIKIKKEK